MTPRDLPKRFRIGDVMRHSGLSRQTIHMYTLLGLIREEEQTPSGHRLYGESVFEELDRIRELRGEGKSLKEIGEMLKREN